MSAIIEGPETELEAYLAHLGLTLISPQYSYTSYILAATDDRKSNLENVMTFEFRFRDLFIDGIMTSIMECERSVPVFCSGRDFITFY